MRMTSVLQPTYILHTRPYRDTSLLIDALTLEQGRISLIAKAGRSPRGRSARFHAVLQAFTPFMCTWRGKTDLFQLIKAEVRPTPRIALSGKQLLCGFYLNELLIRLLPRQDAYPVLFQYYESTLLDLVNHPQRALRCFEKKLLVELGYALQLTQDSQTAEIIRPERNYQFIPSQGLVYSLRTPSHAAAVFSGESLLAIHQEQWDYPPYLLEAKRLFRLAINHLLEGKKLHSRQLWFTPF